DAPPWRNSHPRHESLALDTPVREKHETSGGKKIGLTLEARRNIDASIAHRFEERPVDFALADPRRQQVGEMKCLGVARHSGKRIQKAGVGGIDQAAHSLMGLDYAYLGAVRDEGARESVPLR